MYIHTLQNNDLLTYMFVSNYKNKAMFYVIWICLNACNNKRCIYCQKWKEKKIYKPGFANAKEVSVRDLWQWQGFSYNGKLNIRMKTNVKGSCRQGLRPTHKPKKTRVGFFKKAHSKKPNKTQAQMGFFKSNKKFYTLKNSLSILSWFLSMCIYIILPT